MARDGRLQPFPFPIPDPPRVLPHTPFPPPPLPSPEDTAKVLAHRVGRLPLPLFFAIGTVVGIVLAVTVVSLVRRSSPKKATQAKVVSVQSAAVVEHAHALFVWPPPIAGERAPSTSAAPAAEATTASAAPPVDMPSPARVAPLAPTAAARATVAMNRPRATTRASAAAPAKREPVLPSNLLAAGL